MVSKNPLNLELDPLFRQGIRTPEFMIDHNNCGDDGIISKPTELSARKDHHKFTRFKLQSSADSGENSIKLSEDIG